MVDWTQDGTEGLNLALQNFHDMAILDVMLPSFDSWLVPQALWGRGRQMPVIFFTAHDEVTDSVKSAGAPRQACEGVVGRARGCDQSPLPAQVQSGDQPR